MKRQDRDSSSYNRLKKFRSLKAASNPSDSDDDVQPGSSTSTVASPSCEEQSTQDLPKPLADEREERPFCFTQQSDESDESDGSDNSGSEKEDEDHSDQDGGEGDSESYYSYDSVSDLSDDSVSEDENSDSDEYAHPVEELKSKLRHWSLKNAITLQALSQLLVLILGWLSSHCALLIPWLRNFPRDARTLLHTNDQKFNIRPMASHRGTPGEFVYFGLKNGLQSQVKKKYFPIPRIFLCINVDGLPLYKSSSIGFWCILCKINHSSYEWNPFTVGVYSGPGKPINPQEFLEDFVKEVTDMINNGVTINGSHYEVDIRYYVCDTPARSFLKCVVGHGGYFACERCTVKGENINRKRIYPQRDCCLRTEESFRTKQQEEHHTGTTSLLEIPAFKPVSSFILDYMHLICLGVMRRLLTFYWIADKKKKDISFSPREVRLLSEQLEKLKFCVTSEFPRKLRSAQDIVRFKATELRFFLLYLGPIVLKNILSKDMYKHFLLLHTATRILCCPQKATTHTQYARNLYRHFFSLLPQYYGEDSQIGNMHNVIHIADDVETYQCCLDDMSAFPFENALGKIKRSLRTYTKPLAQYCRRKAELCELNAQPVKRLNSKPSVTLSSGTITKVCFKNMSIAPCDPDNFILLNDGQICEIKGIHQNHDKDIKITGRIWRDKKSIFKFPCKSSQLDEWQISNPTDTESKWRLEDIKAKLIHFIITEEDCTREYAIAVLHSSL